MPEPDTHKNKYDQQSQSEEVNEQRNLKNRFMDLYTASIPLFSVNLAWYVLSLPILTIFPAVGGVYHAIIELHQEGHSDWKTVWEGFKKHGWVSVRWGLLVLAGFFILFVNIWFYLQVEQIWAIFALVALLVITVFWTAINQFSLPMLLIQEEKKIFLAIRNSYVIVMRRPLTAIKVMLITFLILVVSILLPPLWIFISVALIAHIQTGTVLNTIQAIRQQDHGEDVET